MKNYCPFHLIMSDSPTFLRLYYDRTLECTREDCVCPISLGTSPLYYECWTRTGSELLERVKKWFERYTFEDTLHWFAHAKRLSSTGSLIELLREDIRRVHIPLSTEMLEVIDILLSKGATISTRYIAAGIVEHALHARYLPLIDHCLRAHPEIRELSLAGRAQDLETFQVFWNHGFVGEVLRHACLEFVQNLSQSPTPTLVEELIQQEEYAQTRPHLISVLFNYGCHSAATDGPLLSVYDAHIRLLLARGVRVPEWDEELEKATGWVMRISNMETLSVFTIQMAARHARFPTDLVRHVLLPMLIGGCPDHK